MSFNDTLAFDNVQEAVFHNTNFTHRVINGCQICKKLCPNVKYFRAPGTELFMESMFGELLYCSDCESQLPLYSNTFMFSNLMIGDVSATVEDFKVLRSSGSLSKVSMKNCILTFSTRSKQVYFKFKLMDETIGEIFKGNRISQFYETNKDIFDRDDFRLTIKLNKIYTEHPKYNMIKKSWDNLMITPLKELLGDKLIIVEE